ncbi:hypothetical protein NKG05_20635 [Oerskovia sp. M15]
MRAIGLSRSQLRWMLAIEGTLIAGSVRSWASSWASCTAGPGPLRRSP